MSDDEIEIIEKNNASLSGTNDICQLCPVNLHGLSTAERDVHFREHSGETTILARSRRGRPKHATANTSRPRMTPMRSRRSAENGAQEDVFWHPAQAKAPPDNYTPGALSILKDALKNSHRKGATQRAVLCYERTPHIYHESFDSGWGCGYRNFLMTCAALIDQQFQSAYSAHLSSPSLPSVRNLQHWIEDAWKQGYDDIGARDFDHELVNTQKKLGTGDLYVAFTSRKIPCVLVDFDLRNSPKGFDTLTEWVVNHFTEKLAGDVNKILLNTSPVVATGKMPVIMQYDGHSITIVGYELGKNGRYNLLVFDPSKTHKNIRQAALNMSASTNWASSSSILLGKNKRHERSKSPQAAPKKRSRTSEDPDDGIVSVPDSDDDKMDDARRAVGLQPTLDPDTVIKAFRFKKPKKKQDYQLLCFTMDDPLSDQEQNDRKVVFSVAEC